MVARDGRILLSVLLIAGLIGWAGVSQLSSIGIRIVLPFTGGPFLVGIEATTNLSFGLGTGSFLLDSAGRTLIAVGVDIDLGEEGSSARTYLRLTTGIYYFDPSRSFPSPLIGGGISYRLLTFQPLVFGFASEFIYPLAFPVPMFSASGGWSFK